MNKLHVAIIGMGFGRAFPDIYLKHPDVKALTLCDLHPERLNHYSHVSNVRLSSSLNEVLNDPTIDAVHINSGIPDHAAQSIAVLKAGKHCACTVPMATSIEDIRAIIDAVKSSGKNYMMMETQIYAREFLRVCELRDQGVFGRLQFLRGAHYQDMENWPSYWAGLPPMWYSTHAIAPLLSFANSRARSVRCLGSGFMRDELKAHYGNPFPIETAVFEIESETPLCMEITRSLFHSAREYHEGFNIYGEDAALEWPFHSEPFTLMRQTKLGEVVGKPRQSSREQIGAPDYGHLLPPEIASFTGAVGDGRGDHPSIRHGGGHGGSHPHLVHEFIRSIMEERRPAIDVIKAATWTAPGICAHESALKQGERVDIPKYV